MHGDALVSTSIRFANPPVAEVAFSSSFQTSKLMSAAFIGIFWAHVREEFPDFSENSPLPAVVEGPSQGVAIPMMPQLQMLNLPPLRRAVFKSKDGRHIIQLQQDKFILNWTRGTNLTYPDFATAFSEFESKLGFLNAALLAENFGEMTENQYELVYVNLIGPGNGLELVGEGGLLVDHTRRSDGERFLPAPSGFNWTSSYELPSGFGRLHITAWPVLVPPKNERRVRLDMVARGIPPPEAESGRREWFHLAHDWIVEGFTDATPEILHSRVWKRL
jgi:uncharacterized protein (TIGR04255 family)